ncbi:MAG: diguanylate cyclase [Alphaproteobacteria bacterium]|nr:diguanylate cyclase [Alphaproteobacteria bacterium]
MLTHPLTPVWDVLVYVVLPVWVVAGFGDYLCHRASHIERAAGARETLIHWLMLGEVAVPVLAALYLNIDAAVLLAMILFLAAHEATGYIDLRLAMATRKVSALEHQIHSVLEIAPAIALLLVAILHWPQAQALFGFGAEPFDWRISLKAPPTPGELVPPLVSVILLSLLPYGEEMFRDLRARRRARAARTDVAEKK